jgi:hypothetical protein
VNAPQNPEVNARNAVSASKAPNAMRQPDLRLVKKKIGARYAALITADFQFQIFNPLSMTQLFVDRVKR